MKQISTFLSVLSLMAVGVLYYLHFSGKEKKSNAGPETNKADDPTQFRVAYFDIDSLQKNYKTFQEAEEKIKLKDSENKKVLTDMNNRNQRRLRELQEKAPSMTQAEGEAAQRELGNLQQQFAQKELELDQDLKKLQMDLMSELQSKVENYLKAYNQQKGYAYILSYRPGEFIYFKDSSYDITADMVKGLNELHVDKKKKD